MQTSLQISIGQRSHAGVKSVNQDFYGVVVPEQPLLDTKGIAVAVADGISSSQVSHIASETAVSNFLEDFYCTSEAMSVKSSALKVLSAINSWLYSRSQKSRHRYNQDKGYVCTFSGVIFKSNTAHLFHAGDSRIYRLDKNQLEQLTQDHRQVISEGQSYLTNALGFRQIVDLDYSTVDIKIDDVFVLTTDGIHEHVNYELIVSVIKEHCSTLDKAAEIILDAALKSGSKDNLTIQIIKIDQLPDKSIHELHEQINTLPLPPDVTVRQEFDGYQILREIYISNRSHLYLATDLDTQETVVLKLPSNDMRSDENYLESFLMEEWVARRIDNNHVMKAPELIRKRKYIYQVIEYINGQTLEQWMRDNPSPNIEQVRDIVEQIAKGLLAFHRQEMLHQDCRPKNIMIDNNGTVKIIDFGATRVAGLMEVNNQRYTQTIMGTLQYSAPEYFIGEYATPLSDLFSLGVITYQMLCGKLPYGNDISRCSSRNELIALSYRSLRNERPDVPMWVDETIKRAVSLDPMKRYPVLSEFVYDLRHPNPRFINSGFTPIVERNPVLFWQTTSLILSIICILLLVT